MRLKKNLKKLQQKLEHNNMKKYKEFLLENDSTITSQSAVTSATFDETKYKNVFGSLQNFWKNSVLTKRQLNFGKDSDKDLIRKLNKKKKYKKYLINIEKELQRRTRTKKDKIEVILAGFSELKNPASRYKEIVTKIVNEHPSLAVGKVMTFAMHTDQLEEYEKKLAEKKNVKTATPVAPAKTAPTTTVAPTTTIAPTKT